jgi:hypothetical protein
MATLRLEIRTGNAAMLTGEDVAAALETAALQVRESFEYDEVVAQHARAILDVNGNRVGQWKVHATDSFGNPSE